MNQRWLKTYVVFLGVFAEEFIPEIKQTSCPIDFSGLCLNVQFEFETDFARLENIFDNDHVNFEGYFVKKPHTRVFAAKPHPSSMEREDSEIQVNVFFSY